MKDSTVNYQCPTKGNKKGLTGTEVRPQLKNKRKKTKLVLYHKKTVQEFLFIISNLFLILHILRRNSTYSRVLLFPNH